jgi:thiamine-phosphate diphosphorylase
LNLPRLHVIVTDAVAAQPSFLATCEAMLDRCSGDLAIHLRIRDMVDRALLDLAENIEEMAIETDGMLIVNRRVDVALAAGADGVQLGRGSLPVEAVRSSVGDSLLIGASVHDLPAADTAKHGGADYLVVGSVFPTQSHPGLEPAGPELVRAVSDTGLPVIGIGGVTAERAGQVLRAGAYGVAVISAVWSTGDPAAAAENLCEALAC